MASSLALEAASLGGARQPRARAAKASAALREARTLRTLELSSSAAKQIDEACGVGEGVCEDPAGLDTDGRERLVLAFGGEDRSLERAGTVELGESAKRLLVGGAADSDGDRPLYRSPCRTVASFDAS